MNAAETLRKYQKPCDPRGIKVRVSRQALNEVLDEIKRLEGALREIMRLDAGACLHIAEQALNKESLADKLKRKGYTQPECSAADELLNKE